MILLSSSDEGNVCHVETANLDGERARVGRIPVGTCATDPLRRKGPVPQIL